MLDSRFRFLFAFTVGEAEFGVVGSRADEGHFFRWLLDGAGVVGDVVVVVVVVFVSDFPREEDDLSERRSVRGGVGAA